ncbi:MAG: hypothetical protein NZT92_20915 [Abditibacteriales bacterium]|nr:hypothetical protein [Abditibacteriales bacterium]
MNTKQQVSPLTIAASIVAVLVLIGLVWFFGFNRPPAQPEAPDPNQPPALEGRPTPSQLGSDASQAPSPMGAPMR